MLFPKKKADKFYQPLIIVQKLNQIFKQGLILVQLYYIKFEIF